MLKSTIRSPFFYVGDKYKLVPQLKCFMPQHISTYIEPFVGGGSSLLNMRADLFYANDIDVNIIRLHRFISSYARVPEKLFHDLLEKINHYSLSCSFTGETTISEELKKQYPKTYYSHYNKEGYLRMRDDFNADQDNLLLLYLLLIYGFNHMIRYNAFGKFNLPVGNVDFNRNVFNALTSYLDFMRTHNVVWHELDYKVFCEQLLYEPDAYIFCDPPYLISNSEYNKIWNEDKEVELYSLLDKLNDSGVRFGITNLARHKGKENTLFVSWSKKYISYPIRSNYISFNDNTIKDDSKELFVTNYGKC